MRIILLFLCAFATLCACKERAADGRSKPAQYALAGSWRLISGTVMEKGDTTTTDYTKNTSFVKIINETHFAFLQHDLSKGKDTGAVFAAGGGSYSLSGNQYTERLEYCSAREWEGNEFKFTVDIKNDTLIQQGIEKVESAGVNRVNTEKYVRLKN